MNISDRRHSNIAKLGEAKAVTELYIELKIHSQTPRTLGNILTRSVPWVLDTWECGMNISDRRHRNIVELGEAEAVMELYIELNFHFETTRSLGNILTRSVPWVLDTGNVREEYLGPSS